MNTKALKSYKIDPLRLDELRRVCWQYKTMQREAADLITAKDAPLPGSEIYSKGDHADPVYRAAKRREKLLHRIHAIEQCALLAGRDNAAGLLYGVTTHNSNYEIMRANGRIYCGRRQYYEARAKFFFLLDIYL